MKFRERLIVKLKEHPDVALTANEPLVERYAAKANRWHDLTGVYFCPWEKIEARFPSCECVCTKAVEEAVKNGKSECGLLKAKREMSAAEKARTALSKLKTLKNLRKK